MQKSQTTSETHTSPHLIGAEGTDPRGYEDFGGTAAERSSQSRPWWPAPRRAPEKAPNVIVVLVDDMGFSDTAPFGSEIPTPALSRLAGDGFRFTNFRVTPLCTPSRAALMTGVNPHRAGYGFVSHVDPGYPGMRMEIPAAMPTLAETFRHNGYSTFMVGKWHLTIESKMHDGADKSSWPLQRGFDRYFGSMDGFTTLYHPHRIVRDNSPVTEPFADDDYLTDRLTDEAIGMIEGLRANDDKPFFLYFAHHAVHGPVQAKPDDIERYRGSYDAGWDRIRADRFARQKNDGLFAEDVEASPSGPQHTQGVRPWDELSDDERELYARHMEVYAAAITAIDDSVARLISYLEDIGEYENTIIVFTSDNGGTGEGGLEGTRSYFSRFNPIPVMPDDWVSDVPRPLDEIGGPRVHGHYPKGWAHASNTPFALYKGSVAEGGVHSPLIVSWPAGAPRGEGDAGIRDGFTYITDIAPTLEQLCGIERPEISHGHPSVPIDGRSFVPHLQDAAASRQPDGQYLSLMTQRGYYRDGWKIRATTLDDDPGTWALYDIPNDPTETRDLATVHPELVVELAEEWRRAAWHNAVFPLPDEPGMLATRPSTDLELERPITLRPGMPTLERFRSSKLTALRSCVVTATFTREPGTGVVVSHGDQGGGYILWAEDGELRFSYNAFGVMHHLTLPATADGATIRFDALPDFTCSITLEAGGRTARLDRVPMLIGMAPFTGISVGIDGGGPVDWDLHERRGPSPKTGSCGTCTTHPARRRRTTARR